MFFQTVLLFVAVTAINSQNMRPVRPVCAPYRFLAPRDITPRDIPFGGGVDGPLTLYPCRASINDNLVPGKAVMGSIPTCSVSYGGAEYKLSSGFEVLTMLGRGGFRWQAPSTGAIPAGAVAGGRMDTGEKLYIASCAIPGRNFPGNVKQTQPNIMYYTYNGMEMTCNQFNFLVC